MIVAGAVLNHAAGVVGVSNLFAENGDRDDGVGERRCRGRVALSGRTDRRLRSRATISRPRVEDGFEKLGPLRVWINDADERGADA